MEDLRFRVLVWGRRVDGLGFGFRVFGLGFIRLRLRVYGLGFRAFGLGFMA